jgi:hypothetical protein
MREEFSIWCQRNKISPEAEIVIQRIRSSPSSPSGAWAGLEHEWTVPFSENGDDNPI